MTNSTLNKISKMLLVMLLSVGAFTAVGAQVTEEWSRRFTFAGYESKVNDMKTDHGGNIYVAGYVTGKETGKDFMLLKYSPKGEELWSSVTTGEGGLEANKDEARKIMIDDKGNVYVTGRGINAMGASSFRTVKFDAGGNILWDRYFNVHRAIEYGHDEAISGAVDNSGNVIVAGISLINDSYDFTLVKYNNEGDVLWYRTHDRLGGPDLMKDVTVDLKDNIIVTGSSSGLLSGADYLTVKYDADGNELWSDIYNNIGGNIALSIDESAAIYADENGNIFVTGHSSGIGTSMDFATIKLSSEGKREWVSRQSRRQYVRGESSDEIPAAMYADKLGNLIITGSSYPLSGGSDLITVKLNADGTEEWMDLYDSGMFENSLDEATAIAVDHDGNSYITGFVNGYSFVTDCGNESGKNMIVLKYGRTGERKWKKEFNGPGNIGSNDDAGRKVLTDGKGNIYVSGESQGENEKNDICIINFRESGIKKVKDIVADKKAVGITNYPNPFNPETTISFDLPQSSTVRLSIYDINGKMIRGLVNDYHDRGKYSYKWNASDLSSGTYFYRIATPDSDITQRMLLIK